MILQVIGICIYFVIGYAIMTILDKTILERLNYDDVMQRMVKKGQGEKFKKMVKNYREHRWYRIVIRLYFFFLWPLDLIFSFVKGAWNKITK